MTLAGKTFGDGDVYMRKTDGTSWVLTDVLVERRRYKLMRNGVTHIPLTSEELREQFERIAEGDGTL